MPPKTRFSENRANLRVLLSREDFVFGSTMELLEGENKKNPVTPSLGTTNKLFEFWVNSGVPGPVPGPDSGSDFGFPVGGPRVSGDTFRGWQRPS